MHAKNFYLLSLSHQALHWAILGLIIPVISLFQLDKGMNLAQIGVNLAVYSGIIIALEVPTGTLADTLGRKKIYSLALVIEIAGLAIFLLFDQFIALAIGFALMGAGRALSSGTMDAFFVDAFQTVYPGREMNTYFARMNVFILLGLAAGSLSGGYIPKVFGPWLTAEHPFFAHRSIYSATFIIMAAALILQLVYTFFIQQPTESKTTQGSSASQEEGSDDDGGTAAYYAEAVHVVENSTTAYSTEAERAVESTSLLVDKSHDQSIVHNVDHNVNHSSLKKRIWYVISTSMQAMRNNPIILLLFLSITAWGIAFSGVESFWQPQLKSILQRTFSEGDGFGMIILGWMGIDQAGGEGSPVHTEVFGFLSTGYFLFGALGGIVSTLVSKAFKGQHALSLVCIRIIQGVTLLFLAGASGLGPFALLYLLLFFFNGLFEVPHETLFHQEVSSDIRSTMISVESLFLQGGGVLGTLVFGFVSENFSISLSWIIGSLVLIASSLFYVQIHRLQKQKTAD